MTTKTKKWKLPEDPARTIVTGRIIFQMSKPRAKTELVYTEDLSDPWFIFEYTVERKTQKVTERSIFIAKDIPQVLANRQSGGWALEKIADPLDEKAKV
jgi:hypothetical protein